MTSLRDRPARILEIAGADTEVRVRESARARSARIMVGAQRPLEIIVPVGTSDHAIEQLVLGRRDWIAEKLAVVDAERRRPLALGLDLPGFVWLGGEPLPIQISTSVGNSARLVDGVLVSRADGGEQAVMRWYRREARHRIPAAVGRHAERLDLRPRSVAVRDQKTRWGSCSPARNLSFSWRLLIAPADVLDYVVVHELCHLVVANHSKGFWRQLEVAMPTWREQAAWLREHGAELRAYRPRVT